MSKPNITGTNAMYRKKELVGFIIKRLKKLSINNESWKGLPDCDESYLCLKKLNKTMLIKIHECLMALD